MLASNDCTVVEQSSHNPKFKRSNPGAAGTGKERIALKCLQIFILLFVQNFVKIPRQFDETLAVL